MEILSSLQFLNPAALLAGLLIPLLALAYLRQRPAKSRVVPSLILLKALAKQRLIQRRFRPPLHFYFELLALLLLLAAAAAPSIREDRHRVAILLDTSLSMRSVVPAERDRSANESRLARAKLKLTNWLDSQPSASRFTLYTSAPSLEQIGTKLGSVGEASRKLSEIEASLASDTFSASAQQLAESGEYDRLLLVTDHPVELADSSVKSGGKTTLEALSLGNLLPARSANPYLTAIRVTSATATDSARVIAEIGLAGSEPLTIQGELSARVTGADKHSYFQALASREITLNPATTNLLEFELDDSTARQHHFSIELKNAPPGLSNLLAEDDRAWVSREERARNRILLVTPESESENNFGLNLIRGFEVKQLSPQQFTALNSTEIRAYGLVIFRHCVPRSEPPVPALFILPPQDNPFAPVTQISARAAITSWAEAHPLTAYLKVPLLQPKNALVLLPPRWAQPIINVEEGPIFAAGENHGNRSAVLGFEIFPFDGDRSPAYSVLTLNLFRWLSGSDVLDQQFTVGSHFTLDPERSWVVADPSDSVSTIHPTDAASASFTFSKPGIYLLTSISGETQQNLAHETTAVAVNSFFPDESQLDKFGAIYLPQVITHATGKEDTSREPLWPLLALLAMGVLFFEYLLRRKGTQPSTI